MKLLLFLKRFNRYFSKYKHSVEILIFKKNILHNLNEYKQKYPDFLFAPVLKSNAYGHGLSLVAGILDKEKVPFFVVDSLYEASLLKRHNIKTDILIIGYNFLENIQNYNSSRFIFTITSLEELRILSKNIHKSTRFHLKVDTGMHRQGILISEISEAITLIKNNPKIVLEGICSHFADADNQDVTFTSKQIKVWKEVVITFKNEFSLIKYFHLSATSGVDKIDREFTNLVRLGIGLYGINLTSNPKLNLLPALELRSIIGSIRYVKENDSVGYNNTYIFNRESKVATIPLGYFEGVDRRLSNLGEFKYKNNYLKIVGRVSMNITSVDVTDINDLKIEDEITIISKNKDDENSVENIAKKTKTIPYEILVHIPSTLYRKVVK